MKNADTRLTDRSSAHIIHEISQPLAAILTNAGAAIRWLQRHPANLDEAEQAAERILGNSRHAHDVILKMTELTVGVAAAVAPVQLNEIVRDTVNLTGLRFGHHDILVQADLAGSLDPVLGDGVQLRQVFANLIANAIDAMRHIKSRTRVLRISTGTGRGSEVVVAVGDNGTGLDPSHADLIFDPMFTTKHDGTGLGLSICRSIIHAHGGKLWVEPNHPFGSTFYVSLPSLQECIPAEGSM
jgi:signal transduction histidine kinase